MRFDKFIAIPTNLAKRPRTRKRGGTENSANLLGLPEYEGTIADWAKEMYSKVNLPLIALFLIYRTNTTQAGPVTITSSDQLIELLSMAIYFQGYSTSKFEAIQIQGTI